MMELTYGIRRSYVLVDAGKKAILILLLEIVRHIDVLTKDTATNDVRRDREGVM